MTLTEILIWFTLVLGSVASVFIGLFLLPVLLGLGTIGLLIAMLTGKVSVVAPRRRQS